MKLIGIKRNKVSTWFLSNLFPSVILVMHWAWSINHCCENHHAQRNYCVATSIFFFFTSVSAHLLNLSYVIEHHAFKEVHNRFNVPRIQSILKNMCNFIEHQWIISYFIMWCALIFQSRPKNKFFLYIFTNYFLWIHIHSNSTFFSPCQSVISISNLIHSILPSFLTFDHSRLGRLKRQLKCIPSFP